MSGLNTLWLRVFQGRRAVVFHNYTEVNVKLGRQRVASTILTVNAGATVHWWQTFYEGLLYLPLTE